MKLAQFLLVAALALGGAAPAFAGRGGAHHGMGVRHAGGHGGGMMHRGGRGGGGGMKGPRLHTTHLSIDGIVQPIRTRNAGRGHGRHLGGGGHQGRR